MASSHGNLRALNEAAAMDDGSASRSNLLITADDGSERVVALAGRDLRIGRSSENDVVLPDANKGVSRTHAELRVEGGRYVIVDLQSQNGTWINGERVERANVPPDAEIAIGLYRLRLQGVPPISVGDMPLRRAEPVIAGMWPSTSRGRAVAAPTRRGAARFQKPALFAGGVAAGIVVLALVWNFAPASRVEPPAGAPAPTTVDTAPSSAVESNEPKPAAEPPAPAPEAAAVAVPAATDAPAVRSPARATVPDASTEPNVVADRGRARDAFEAGNKLDVADDWVGALRKYDQARQFDRSLPGLDRAMKQVWEKMREAGRSALNRAREYDAIGHSADALKEYDKAVQWLPPDDANRAVASGRAAQLRAGAK